MACVRLRCNMGIDDKLCRARLSGVSSFECGVVARSTEAVSVGLFPSSPVRHRLLRLENALLTSEDTDEVIELESNVGI
jgi:hypothetical protein